MIRTALSEQLGPPTVTAKAARVVALTFDGVDIEMDVEVANPNAMAIDIAGYDYHVEIAGKRVAEGTASERRTVDGGSATMWTVPVSLRFGSLLSSVASLATEDETTFAFECAVRIDMPFVGEVTIPVSRIGALPIPKPPSISFAGISLRGGSLTAADLGIKLRLDNPNSFLMRVASLTYDLGVGDQKWVSASQAAGVDVLAHGSAIVDIPVSVDLRAVGAGALALLRDPGSVPLLLSGVMRLSSPLPGMTDAALPFTLRAMDRD